MANDLLRGRQTVAPLTNKSGGGVVAGDVVVLDSTTASSFTTTTTAAQTADWIGVALETIANNAVGRVLLFGYAPIINLASSASLGDYLRTHTVAKQAQRFASTGAGDFGQVLGTGTTPAAMLWARPDQGTGGIRVDEVDGSPNVTGVSRLTVPNGTLTDNGGGQVTITTGGSGGNAITAGVYASRPAAGTSGNLYLPTDAAIISEDTGSAWRNFGPIHLLTKPPTVASGTWLNQGSATITEEKELLHLFLPKESVLNIRGMHWAAPATPYTITALISFNPIVVSQMMFGVMWRQSSDGKLVTAHLETATSSLLLNVYKWTSPTVFSAVYVSLNWWQHRVWVKLEDDGTNRKVHISTDGLYFTQIHTVGRTDFLTANQVGFFGIANTASAWDMHGTLLSWVAA